MARRRRGRAYPRGDGTAHKVTSWANARTTRHGANRHSTTNPTPTTTTTNYYYHHHSDYYYTITLNNCTSSAPSSSPTMARDPFLDYLFPFRFPSHSPFPFPSLPLTPLLHPCLSSSPNHISLTPYNYGTLSLLSPSSPLLELVDRRGKGGEDSMMNHKKKHRLKKRTTKKHKGKQKWIKNEDENKRNETKNKDKR